MGQTDRRPGRVRGDRAFRKRWAAPALIALAGLSVSALLFVLSYRSERARAVSAFAGAADERVMSLQREIDVNLSEIQSTGSFYDASYQVERREFHTFAEHYLTHDDGLRMLQWIPRVSHARRNASEEAARKDGLSGFQIRERGADGRMVKAGRREEYFPVYFVEPCKNGEAALGYDLGSDSAYRPALEAARDTGKMVSTKRIDLDRAEEDRSWILVFHPIYSKDAKSKTVSDRRKNLLGFVLGAVHIKTLIDRAVSHLDTGSVDFHVFDASQYLGFHSSRSRSVPARPIEAKDDAMRAELKHVGTFDVAGRTWTVICTPAPVSPAVRPVWNPWVFLASGVAFTCLGMAYIGRILKVSRETEQYAHQIARTKERLEGEVEERKQAEQVAQAYQQDLQHLAAEMSVLEERNRRTIAAELHDRIGQNLMAARMKIESLRKQRLGGEESKWVDELLGLADDTIKDVWSLTYELCPPMLYELGLEPAVEWLLEEFGKNHGLACEMQCDGYPREANSQAHPMPLTDEIKGLLFQATREVLTNVVKHAQARKVCLTLSADDRSVTIRIEDDGVGFDPSKGGNTIPRSGGFGLFSIRERLRHAGGRLEIHSEPGKGCRITLIAPLAG